MNLKNVILSQLSSRRKHPVLGPPQPCIRAFASAVPSSIPREGSAWALEPTSKGPPRRPPSTTPREMTACPVALLTPPGHGSGCWCRRARGRGVVGLQDSRLNPHGHILPPFKVPPNSAPQMATHLKPERGRMREPHL